MQQYKGCLGKISIPTSVTNDYILLYITKESLLRIVYHCLITSTPGTTSVV